MGFWQSRAGGRGRHFLDRRYGDEAEGSLRPRSARQRGWPRRRAASTDLAGRVTLPIASPGAESAHVPLDRGAADREIGPVWLAGPPAHADGQQQLSPGASDLSDEAPRSPCAAPRVRP